MPEVLIKDTLAYIIIVLYYHAVYGGRRKATEGIWIAVQVPDFVRTKSNRHQIRTVNMFNFLICDSDEEFCRREKAFIEDYYFERNEEVSCDIFQSGDDIKRLGDSISSYDAIFLSVNMADNLRHILKDSGKDEMDRIISIDKKKRVPADNILYVESKGHKIIYHLVDTDEEDHSVYGKLDDAEAKLGRHGFCRIHQSYLVNMSYVRDVCRYEALLFDGKAIRISKERYKKVEEALIREKGRC